MPKSTRAGGASNAAAERDVALPPANAPEPVELPEREHQLNGPSEGVGWPADGTESPEIEGNGSGEALPPVEDDGEGEPLSVGSSSETSPERPPSSPVTSGSALPKRARTTGSRSSKGRTGSSTARSTGSSTEADAASENE